MTAHPDPRILFLAFFVLFSTGAQGAVQQLARFPGENTSDQFAISLCNAGDVDGDGYNDLLIGASLEDTGGDGAGKCYLYLGGVFADTVADWTATAAQGDRFGSGVAGNGDVNDDGFSDFAVAAIGATTQAPFTGRVYVFFGGGTPDDNPDLVVHGPAANARFGEAMSIGGDVNDDGYSDLIVGATRADTTGVVYVYYGGVPMDTIPDLVLRGESNDDRFGSAVGAGDLNGDGADDLVVGAERNSQAALWAGKVYIFFGGALIDTIPDLVLTGEAAGDGFGKTVGICKDFNGDGQTDLFVASPFFNAPTAVDAGKVYLYLGGALLDNVSDGQWVGENADDYFGRALSSADANEDGLSDLIAGAPGFGTGQSGKMYLFYGGLPANATADFTDAGAGEFDNFGASVAGLGRYKFYPPGSIEFVAGGWNVNNVGEARLYGEPVIPSGIPSGTPRYIDLVLRPNPFREALRVSADLPARGPVAVVVYDVLGRRVGEIFEGHAGPGPVSFTWSPRRGSGAAVRPGVYFLRFRYGPTTVSRKVVFLR